MPRTRLRRSIARLLPLLIPAAVWAGVIEDFDGAAPELVGYPGEAGDPGAWALVTPGDGGGGQALRINGNLWLVQTMAPRALADSTVWSVAVSADTKGEVQAIGFGDGVHELFYTFAGRDLPAATNWWTVYQGSLSLGAWHDYLLPVGEDWRATFGELPVIDRVIYVNDADAGTVGVTRFDSLADVSGELPRAPQVEILYAVESSVKVAGDLYRLSAQFQATVFDPDSDTHAWRWDFGDGTSSAEPVVVHEFLVHADHPYTVSVAVTDPDGLCGGDTCQVVVHPGGDDLPLTVNFVGDVFTGRGYESAGGIIDTQGIEALFAPTRPIFGDAADVNVCNLEVSYNDRGTPHPTKSVVFRSRPENIAGLAYAGVDLVTIGNNHIIDYGEIGMLDTMDGLESLGIPWCGAGSNETFALQPAFWTERGVRLGFVGLCDRTGRQWNFQPFLDAGASKPGFAHLLPDNLEKTIAATADLSDLVIVQSHSGDEYQLAPPPGALGRWAGPDDSVDVETAVPDPDAPEFRFLNEPTPGERALRRQAIDLGADAMINHHPHVLQGFESYRGKLIAHSLGNFVFDLTYAETMPTLVLTLEMDKHGITGQRFTPAFIDDWIPRPATGNLGREIIGWLAEASRPMNAIVVPLAGKSEARILLSRADADSTVTSHETAFDLTVQDGYEVSPPLALVPEGDLSQVLEVLGGATGGWEVAWGRELLWHTGFEDEGADFWEVNSSDEWIAADEAHGGARSLCLRRDAGDGVQTGSDLERHLPCRADRRHSAVGWLKADNAGQARSMVRFYDSRSSESPLSSTDLAARVDGSYGWTHQWRDLATPAGAVYFELRCGLEPPASGTALAWFDDLALIEWEPWQAVDEPLKIPAPNNYRFLQVRRAGAGAGSGVVRFTQTFYAGVVPTDAGGDDLPAPRSRLSCHPNPFNPRTTIDLVMPGDGAAVRVDLEVYDLRGRCASTLFSGALVGGQRYGFTWDGTDDHGRSLAAGVYFCRARMGAAVQVLKLTLVR